MAARVFIHSFSIFNPIIPVFDDYYFFKRPYLHTFAALSMDAGFSLLLEEEGQGMRWMAGYRTTRG
jgi:hypothetical protein